MALRQRLQPVRAQRGHGHVARGERLVDLRHVLLRRREHDRDRLQLARSSRCPSCRSRARCCRGRRGGSRSCPRAATGSSYSSSCVWALSIAAWSPLICAVELIDGRLLGVELLARGEFLLGERAVALQVELRVLEVRLVLRLLRERLIERRLIRAADRSATRISPSLTIWPCLKSILMTSPSTRLRTGDGVVRFHGAEPVQIDGEIGLLRLRDGDWDGNGPLVAIGHCRRALSEKVTPAEIAAKRDPYQDSDDRPSAAEK